MTDTIYGDHYNDLVKTLGSFLRKISNIRYTIKDETAVDPIEKIEHRIKTDESMREKCRRKGLPETSESALYILHDAIGIRIICKFLNDVYTIKNKIKALNNIEIIEEKDYIQDCKPNGYRSYHLIIRYLGYFIEIQLRTISQNTWSQLEHQVNYKQPNIDTNIAQILKLCADQLASADLTMQKIKFIIN